MNEAGLWTDGMTVRLNCAVTAGELSDSQIAQNRLLQQMLDTATAGTSFEGKIQLIFCSSEDRYAAVANGQIEMGYGAWGGAPFDPYGLMQCYCDPEFNTIQEGCGFDPSKKLLTLLINDEAITRTYSEWCSSLLSDGEYSSDPLLRASILAMLEEALLKEHRFIVLASGAKKLVISDKIIPGTDVYSILSSFGGIRSLSYRYDDAQWAARIADRD